ncbi:FAD-dependent oxidoreductase [Dactylosporangium matsuzakiense]|uniref:D-amino-acid oxidase n=2 Tax=Dactylosporangium matsuzakiense TaxID=53360 RepID=A0A9W6NLH8_9ACTN|nr:FAD-dependent oxidoreductase [Dactylosporangium matsuzakiense]UWZ49417.1 FAD-dependent oxidoreductase [Dactylosporangium matsuzakiense]GLL01975.1 amino acid oxidase [Dactylosporangium matsuzakiense]
MDDVIVLGAGVIGLTCAVRLLEAGARVRVLTADAPETTVSRLAAAVWYPTRTAADPRVLAWARAAYDEFMSQAADGVPGVARRPTRMVIRDGEAGTPWWAAAVPDFAAYPGEWRFTVPSVEMQEYTRWLVALIQSRGGVVARGRVASLRELGGRAGTVVNATGLASRVLAGDSTVFPARGQIVGVANPGLVTSVRDEGHPGGMAYIHPRSRDVVLGGTFQPGDWNETPDPATTAAILERCAELVPELAGAQPLWDAAGLRPTREGGPRLEIAPEPLPSGTRLVHCYGHGGAGVTLSWGCADEVAGLVA